MKNLHCAFAALLVSLAVSAQAAQSGGNDTNPTADERASCNASFHDGCARDSGGSVSASGFAAPAGGLGTSAPESGALLILAGLVAWGRRLNRLRRRT